MKNKVVRELTAMLNYLYQEDIDHLQQDTLRTAINLIEDLDRELINSKARLHPIRTNVRTFF